MIIGESLRARKSLMRMRIDQSIMYRRTSNAGTHRISLDYAALRWLSVLGVAR